MYHLITIINVLVKLIVRKKQKLALTFFSRKLLFLELLYKQQQTYFSSHPIEIPYYLCVRTVMHIDDIPSLHAKQFKKPIDKYAYHVHGEKQLEYEYWFSVPKEK